MRIGLVTMQAAEQRRYVVEVAEVLARAGHDVHVYTRRDEPTAPPAATAGGVVVEYGPAGPPEPADDEALPPHVDEFATWLGQQWRDWRPDVVHAHFWLSGLAAVDTAHALGIPVVQTYHSLGSVRRRWYGRAEPGTRERVRQERALGRSVDRVIAQCQAELSELIRLGVPRDTISVVPSGVDTELFTPHGDRAQDGTDHRRILAIGRRSLPNGFDEMISALRWAPEAELVIAGGPPADRLADDPGAQRMRRLAEDTGVADRVRLVGAVPGGELPTWYRSAHVYASTAAYESFGMPAVEAMACGAPVVAYAVGGLVDSVVHRVTGLLVRPHDVRGFGTTLRRLLNSDVDRLAYADAAADRAQVRYDWHRVIVDLERVYAMMRGAPG